MTVARLVTIAVPSLAPVRAVLRPLTGSDEAVLAPHRAGEPTRLLASLARAEDGSALDLSTLPVTVHDRLLADVYRAEVGEKADCRSACSACREPFEFQLVLADLIEGQDRDAAACGPADADGRWSVGATRVRPPTLADATGGLAAVCEPPSDEAALLAVVAFLEQASPLLALDLGATCPHCGAAQRLGFDLPRFLVRVLANDRPFLIRETHLIAARYGWGHAEIMALPRDDRRAHAALIESERSAGLRPRATA